MSSRGGRLYLHTCNTFVCPVSELAINLHSVALQKLVSKTIEFIAMYEVERELKIRTTPNVRQNYVEYFHAEGSRRQLTYI